MCSERGKKKNQAKGRTRHCGGFTLIEAVCALALLTIVFSGFMVLATSAAATNERSRQLDVSFAQATATLATDAGSSQTVVLQMDGSDTIVEVLHKQSTGEYRLQLLEPQKAATP